MQSALGQIGAFIGDEKIGAGSFASVWAAHHSVTGAKVAIKVIPKSISDSEAHHARLIREISLMKQVRHLFIAPLFSVLDDLVNYYMVMELAARGSLRDRINVNGYLNEDEARHYFCQMVCVLEYLHNDKRIAHRDLKCENILFDAHNNIRVIDFGLSRSCEGDAMHTACGSPAYAAPEVIMHQPYTFTADIWSLGVVLYAMTVGVLPFNHDEIPRLLALIVEQPVAIPGFLSRSLTDLLGRLLCKSADKRIRLDQIKNHPWFPLTEYIETIEICRYEMEKGNARGQIPDNEILLSMAKFGFNSSLLIKELYQDIETDGTLVYAIMKREALAKRMEGIGTGRIKLMLDRIPAVLKISRWQTTKPSEVPPTIGAATRKEPRSLHACFRAGQRSFRKSRKA
jgi:serine/threonine protein kinase